MKVGATRTGAAGIAGAASVAVPERYPPLTCGNVLKVLPPVIGQVRGSRIGALVCHVQRGAPPNFTM